TQRNAWAALMRGDIDMLYDVSRDAVDFVSADSTIQTYSFPRPYYNVLLFNVRHPVLRSVAVRRAINQALDKETLIREGLTAKGRPPNGPLLPEHGAYSIPRTPLDFNPVAARAELDDAGFPVRTDNAAGMPARFSIDCLYFSDDPRFERLA